MLAEVLNELSRAPAPAKPTPASLPADPAPTPEPTSPSKSWGPLGWSILGLAIAVALVVAAFTLPLPF